MIVDVALALGILSSLVALSDFVLRPAQRKAIRRLVDDITLRLEYTRPLTWLNSIQQPYPVSLWVACLAYIPLFPFLVMPVRWFNLLLLLIYFLSLFGAGALWPLIVFWQRGQSVIRQLQSAKTFRELASHTLRLAKESMRYGLPIALKASFISSLVSLLILALLMIVIELTIPSEIVVREINQSSDTVGRGISVVIGAATWSYLHRSNPHRCMLWLVGIPLVISVFVFAGILSVAEMIFKALRGAFWRIAEFEKGPVAALTILLTTILAILKLFITN
jgi:hypothetical protein